MTSGRHAVRTPRENRGVALLTALILLALMTAIATVLSRDTGLSIRQQQGASAQEQAWQLAGATEALAGWALRDELVDPALRIHYGQRWRQPLGPIEPVPGYLLEAQLEDLQGRFNLNSLIASDGRIDPTALELFEDLLTTLGLEPDWAERMADWLDADDQPSPRGGEEAYHTSASPAARPANQRITSTSELLALPGFGMARYQQLAPHVAALPPDAGLNLCTATAAVLDSLSGEQLWMSQSESLQRSQAEQCFPGKDAVRNAVGDPVRFAELERSLRLGENSRYFGLQTWLQIGSVEYALYSVMRFEPQQDGVAPVSVLIRESQQ